MKFWIGLMLVFTLIACGKITSPVINTSNKPKDSSEVKSPDKDYLKKRPEEFREFFMLSNIIPFTGKIATKKDVNKGEAVFYLNSKGDTTHKVIRIRLPFYAFLKQKNGSQPKFIAVMQAESLKGDTILGYKEASGLFGICKPRELEYFESGKNSIYSTIPK